MIFNIRGHEVDFPHQPYGVQLSFMEKMIRTLEEQGNALLEAPTGCGKTLSLLCAALAWQTKRKKEIIAKTTAKLARGGSRSRGAAAGSPSTGAHGSPADGKGDDEDFMSGDSGTRSRSRGKPAPGVQGQGDVPSPLSDDKAGGHNLDSPGDELDVPPIPKIYFATRTHSQIAQVVRELKRTGYKPSMAILAAKQHYCINKNVLKTGRVDEECERLLKEDTFGCRFRSKPGTKAGRVQVQVHDIEELSATCSKQKTCPYFVARDMALTAELVFCPYSYLLDPLVRAALSLDVSGSVLIFDEAHNMEDVCREGGSMDLDLDALREVHGSLKLAAELTGRPELYEPLAEAAGRLAALLGRFEESTEGMTPAGFEEHEAVWQGPRALNLLDEAGLGPMALAELYRAYELAKAYEEKATFAIEGDAANEAVPSSVTRPGAGGGALGTLGRLLTVLRLMYAPAPPHPAAPVPAAPGPGMQRPPLPQFPNGAPSSGYTGMSQGGMGSSAAAGGVGGGGFIPQTQGPGGRGPPGRRAGGGIGVPMAVPQVARDNTEDYRVVVKRWIAHGHKDRRKARSRLRKDAAEGEAAVPPGAAVSLGLWCMNPAVAFRNLAEKAHSVILTSGTLAPLDSFASELGTEFHMRLEAPHVVDMSRQVWASVVPRGPGGCPLSATFKESATFRFQDDAGEAVLRYCQVIPDGVLLFMPSYGLLDKLMTRWKSTGLWSRLEQTKTVVVEGREAGKGFEDAMARYYAAVRSGKGGLFLAVCRGKASEGIDFADQHARGVILLGIPFPAIKDTKVRLKKEYNDASSGPSSGRPPAKRLLNGDAWYNQQAFRALNQAVGRCIRHKYDWGAIILLDERFRGQSRQQQLSRWVRTAVKVHEDFDASLTDLATFCKNLTAEPPRPLPPPQSVGAQPPATSGAPAKAGARRGAKGIDLQYEEDVVPPPDMVQGQVAAAAGNGGALERFRMGPPAGAPASTPEPQLQTASAGGGGDPSGSKAPSGKSSLIHSYFTPARANQATRTGEELCGGTAGDRSACCGGPGGPNASITANEGQVHCRSGVCGSNAVAVGVPPNMPGKPCDPNGHGRHNLGDHHGMLPSQQATQQYHAPQPRLPGFPSSGTAWHPHPQSPSHQQAQPGWGGHQQPPKPEHGCETGAPNPAQANPREVWRAPAAPRQPQPCAPVPQHHYHNPQHPHPNPQPHCQQQGQQGGHPHWQPAGPQAARQPGPHAASMYQHEPPGPHGCTPLHLEGQGPIYPQVPGNRVQPQPQPPVPPQQPQSWGGNAAQGGHLQWWTQPTRQEQCPRVTPQPSGCGSSADISSNGMTSTGGGWHGSTPGQPPAAAIPYPAAAPRAVQPPPKGSAAPSGQTSPVGSNTQAWQSPQPGQQCWPRQPSQQPWSAREHERRPFAAYVHHTQSQTAQSQPASELRSSGACPHFDSGQGAASLPQPESAFCSARQLSGGACGQHPQPAAQLPSLQGRNSMGGHPGCNPALAAGFGTSQLPGQGSQGGPQLQEAQQAERNGPGRPAGDGPAGPAGCPGASAGIIVPPAGQGSSCTDWMAGQRPPLHQRHQWQPQVPVGGPVANCRTSSQQPMKRLTSNRAREAANKRTKLRQEAVSTLVKASNCAGTGTPADNLAEFLDDADDFVDD